MTTIAVTMPDWFINLALAYMGISTVLGVTDAYLTRKLRKLTEEANALSQSKG